jgi:hypothetical protein
MPSATKGIIIFLTAVIVWCGVFVLIYFNTDQIPEQTAITTQTTASSDITQTSTPLTSEEWAYMQTLEYYDNMVVSAVTAINTLLANPQISNETWAQQVANQAGIIVALNQTIAQIPTPGSMYYAQTVYLYAMGYYNTAVNCAVQGINMANASYLSFATAYMEAGTNARSQAITLLNDYMAAHS